MPVQWETDIDTGLAKAQQENRAVLLDFSAAPMWGACARLDAEVYPDERVSALIGQRFVPIKVHVKENPQGFQRFSAQWTPTVIVADPEGTERYRFEGYLPAEDFLAHLALGLAKAAFARSDWAQAERGFQTVLDRHPQSELAPEALYWAGVSRYKASGEAAALQETARAFQSRYRGSSWAKKASVWAG